DKEVAKQYIDEVQSSYTLPKVMPANYIDINYTEKPFLPWDPQKITEFKIKTLLTQLQELIALEPRPDQLENNCKIPDNMETVREMIKEVQSEIKVMLPITKYEDIERTVEILKIKFNTSYIPQNLLQLPELDMPKWNLPITGKDTITTTNIEMTNEDITIMGSHQLTKIENIKPFEHNPSKPLKIITHNAWEQRQQIKQAQQKIMNWVHQASAKQMEVIVLGDFNNNCYNRTIPKNHIVIKLQQAGLTSLMNFYDITESTWSGRGSESQIDDFWVSRDTLVLLTEPKVALAENITDSNHKIVSTELVLLHLLKNKQRKRIKRKRYLYDRMSDKDWQNFIASLEKKVDEKNLVIRTLTIPQPLTLYGILGIT
ncbi:26967_t:CDS:2, partial [Gigaspora margarita]